MRVNLTWDVTSKRGCERVEMSKWKTKQSKWNTKEGKCQEWLLFHSPLFLLPDESRTTLVTRRSEQVNLTHSLPSPGHPLPHYEFIWKHKWIRPIILYIFSYLLCFVLDTQLTLQIIIKVLLHVTLGKGELQKGCGDVGMQRDTQGEEEEDMG